MATVIYSVGAIVSGALGNEYPIPPYSQLVHPEQKDTRTAQDIVQSIINKL